jgi:hypothetical protein
MKNGAKEAAAAVPGVTLNNPFVAAPERKIAWVDMRPH